MAIGYDGITTIGFDADDTLWVNETYFREAEHKFASLLSEFETENTIDQELFKTEIRNLGIYGYGIKGFMLSMIESAIELSNGTVDNQRLLKILEIGKDMIEKPVEVLEGVEEVLKELSPRYRLFLLTKGDLLDQERKLDRSGLSRYFHHIEVLSDKKPANYQHLLDHLEVSVDEFLMVGNSLKSDVLPLIEIGARAIHVPFHTTWVHEEVREHNNHHDFHTVDHIKEILSLL